MMSKQDERGSKETISNSIRRVEGLMRERYKAKYLLEKLKIEIQK